MTPAFCLALHLNGQQGEVAISPVWLKISRINKGRSMKINDRVTSEYLLFNTKKKQGIIYTRWEGSFQEGSHGHPGDRYNV